ncbi:hypothetical protein B0H19DRAFT_1336077 [Mycena capillaripes]|nr:hypothetical protein B0H19DRAFT_1336077 [Mycena capillaripes]
MLSMSSLQFAFIAGMLWTLVCVTALRELFKNGLGPFPAPSLPIVQCILISIYLAVLDIVVLLPRLRSCCRPMFRVKNGRVPPQDPAQDSSSSVTIFLAEHPPRSPAGSLLPFESKVAPTAVDFVLGGNVSVPKQACDVDEHLDATPGAYNTGYNRTILHYLCALPLLAFCVPLFIGWHSINYIMILFRVLLRTLLKCTEDKPATADHSAEDDDITLVEESASPTKDGSEISECVPLPSSLPVSHSAPVVGSTQDVHSGPTRSTSFQLRTDAASFIPSVCSRQAGENTAVQADVVDPKPVQVTLKPLASAFFPVPRTPDAVLPIMDNSKNDWHPTKPLSFRRTRRGCATRIAAPRAPAPLNASAAAFVPKARTTPTLNTIDEDDGRPGLSASIGVPSAVPPVAVKNPVALKSNLPSFWSPGGCAIRIVVPPIVSSPSA